MAPGMMSHPARRSALLASLMLAAIAASPASAADGDAVAPDATGGESPQDGAAAGEDAIVVTGHALRDMGLMAGSVELAGDDLVRASAPQIGDLLAKLPGVSATGFAPGASRPILRGLSGDRVQVLIDGIGSLDASSVSADHGVALDTLTIDHIDVLHGPAVLAYGGQAIGGAVVAYDKRIPRRMPEGPFDLVAIGGFGSATDGKSASASLDVPLGGQFVGHVDASWHRDNDLRVGGDVISAPLKADLLTQAAGLRASGDTAGAAELEAATTLHGRVPGTFARGTTFGGGLAWLGDGGSLGVSLQRIDSRYGVASRPGNGEDGVAIDLGQTRADLRGELKLGGLFDSLQLRAAYADYGHDEIEDGIAGTHFARKAGEGRLELIQADNGGWTGRSGVQFAAGKLAVTGEEAILPINKDSRTGIFTLQQVKLGKLDLEAAGRIERVSIRASSIAYKRDFTLTAGAAGIAFHPSEAIKLGLNYSHGERAPSAEELLTNGLHVATQAFEIGNADFGKERSNGFEAYVQYDTADTKLRATAYLTDYSGFITPMPTGGDVEGFPVYAYQQLPARFLGFEAQGSQVLARWGDRSLTVDASGDYVHAQLKDAGPVPRIPPLRVQGGLEYGAPGLTLRGEVEWNAAQNRVGPFENPTRAFTLVNASATWQPAGEDGPLTLILAADNLFDVLGRRASSFTRDFVPISGRDLRLTAKLSF
jgi:iron complex outermembrane receptor protein